MGYRYRVTNNQGEILTLASKQNNELVQRAISGGVWELAPWKPRLREAELFTRAGLVISGDEQPSKRIIPITWTSSSTNEEASFHEMNYISRFFRPDLGEFFVIDDHRRIRFRTRLDSYQPKSRINGDVRVVEHKLKLLMLDSSVEDAEPSDRTEDLAPNVATRIVRENVGSLNSFPRIEITAGATTAITAFSLINGSNNTGLFWNFPIQATQTLVLDSGGNGEITVEGVDRSFGILRGGLISFRPGDNEMTVTNLNASATMRIIYRSVYAF